MRFTWRAVLVAVLTAGFVASVDAQDRQRQRPGQGQRQPGGFGGGMGMFGGQMNVYSMVIGFNNEVNPVLKEELNITDDQADKLKEAMQPIREKQREAFQGFRPGGERPTEEQMRERREQMEKMAEETKTAVESALKPEQVKRLRQINIQLQGPRAFTTKEVQEALQLTDDQKEQIQGIVSEFGRDVMEVTRAGFGRGGQQDPEAFRQRMQENQRKIAALTKEAEEKVHEKLTDEQKSKLKELHGEKFDTARLTQPRRQRDN
jgi:DNA-binding transcriptional MerR regulator